MAGPPNEYRTLRTINTFLISGAGFSIAAKTRKKIIKKKEDKKEDKEEDRRKSTKYKGCLKLYMCYRCRFVLLLYVLHYLGYPC